MARAGAPFAMRLGQQRRRARHEQAHVRRRLARQIGPLQQACVEGRHAHHAGGARHQAHDLGRIELWQEEHAAARQQQRVRRHEKPVRMVDRQGVDEHVVRREAPVIDERFGVGIEIVVAEHGALGAPRRARRVEDGGEIVGAPVDIGERGRRGRALFGEGAVVVRAERLDRAHTGLLSHGQQRVAPRGIAHEDRGAGVRQEVGNLVRRIGRVQRQEHRTGAHAGEIEEQRLGRFLHLHGDAVSRRHAEPDERIGETCRALGHIAIGESRAVAVLDEDLVGRGEAAGDTLVEIGGHGN